MEGVVDYATSWLETALRKFDEEEDPVQKLKRIDIVDWLQYSYYHSGNPLRALQLSEEVKELDPEFPTVDSNIHFYTKLLTELPESAIKDMEEQSRPTPIVNVGGHYEALCRGEGKLVRKIENIKETNIKKSNKIDVCFFFRFS